MSAGLVLRGVVGAYVLLTMKWFLMLSGILLRKGMRISESSRVTLWLVPLVKGIARVRPFRGA
jgi:hypothetical protein